MCQLVGLRELPSLACWHDCATRKHTPAQHRFWFISYSQCPPSPSCFHACIPAHWIAHRVLIYLPWVECGAASLQGEDQIRDCRTRQPVDLLKRLSSLPFQCVHIFSCVRYFLFRTGRKLFPSKSYSRHLFKKIVFVLKESMIVTSNTKISRTFLCDELVQPDATDLSTFTHQDSLPQHSCKIKTCMSQCDSMLLMDNRLSLLELSPSELDSPLTGKLKAFTVTYPQSAYLKKNLVVKVRS